jgi:Ubiquitin carboxyl-terminal hydrolase
MDLEVITTKGVATFEAYTRVRDSAEIESDVQLDAADAFRLLIDRDDGNIANHSKSDSLHPIKCKQKSISKCSKCDQYFERQIQHPSISLHFYCSESDRISIADKLEEVVNEKTITWCDCSGLKELGALSKEKVNEYAPNGNYLVLDVVITLNDGTNNKLNTAAFEIETTLSLNGFIYSLISIVFHIGKSNENGHYITVSKRVSFDKVRWVIFNDHCAYHICKPFTEIKTNKSIVSLQSIQRAMPTPYNRSTTKYAPTLLCYYREENNNRN